MADIDIDPFGEHESRPEEPTSENIPLAPVGGGSTWEPECEQETSFGGGLTQETRVTNSYVDSLYKELSKQYSQTSDVIHYDNFKCKGKQLYYRGRDEPLTKEGGKFKAIGKLISILGKNRLIDLSFDIPKGLTPQQSVILNKAEEKLPSTPDVDKANEIELQEIIESAAKSRENLIGQFKRQEMLPMRELLGLDKQIRRIRGLLKVEVA